MKAKSLQSTTVLDLKSTILRAFSDDFQPTLGIVFNSVHLDSQAIIHVFNDLQLDLVGCTTSGEIIDDTLAEDTISVMLLEVNKANYAIHTFSYENDTYKSAFEASAVIKQSFEKNALLVLAASFGKDAVGIVEGLQHGLDKDTAIYGGLAGDDLTFSGTFAYSNHFYSHKGTAVLVFDAQKIKVQGLAISGWKSIGTTKKITKSIGNVVYEIDGERAYDVFTRYFGVFNPNDTRHLVSLQTNYPFQIARESDTILRSPMMLNAAEGTISLMGRVNEGDNFRFSNSPGFEVIEETVEAFQQLKDKVEEVDALVLFSCKGRQGAFGPMLEDEVSGLYNYWKKPMIGFLSYGEIGNLSTGSCEFHNETCVLVALKEQV